MGYLKDAQGNIIGQTPDPWDSVAPPQQQPAPNPAGFQGVGGAGNAPAPPINPDAPNTSTNTGAGGQPNFRPAVASEADIAAARADIERRRQAAAANKPPPRGPGSIGMDGPPQQPGMGGLGRVIGYSGGTPAHFEQAGTYYRGTPEQKQAIMGVLGANADRIQAQGDASAAELQHLERINSAADIEALKARKANQAQGIIDEMEAVDRDQAHQAVREAIDKHASMAAPDPARYWGGLGFAGSVGMILADSLDRIGSSMKGEKPSNLIERGIERSLQQQQAALDKSRADITQAQGLYAQMRQSGMDKEHAFQAAKARRMEDAAGIIDSYQRQARLPQVKQQLAMQAADLRERAGASFLQLSESIAGQGKGRQVAATSGTPIYAGGDLKQRKAMAEVLKAEAEARKTDAESQQAANKARGLSGDMPTETEVKIKRDIAETEATIERLKRLRDNAPTPESLVLTPMAESYFSRLPGLQVPESVHAAASWKAEAGGLLAEEMKKTSGTVFTPKEMEIKEKDIFGHNTSPEVRRSSLNRHISAAQKRLEASRAMLPTVEVNKHEARLSTEGARTNLRGK